MCNKTIIIPNNLETSKKPFNNSLFSDISFFLYKNIKYINNNIK